MRVGLHNHTCFSDGRLSPAELIGQAEKLGYERFAITDHNLLSGWQSLGTLPSWVVPGIELSALTENGTEIHLLGLDVKPKADLLAHSRYFTDTYSDLWQEGVFIVTGDAQLAALARDPLTRTQAVDQICEHAGAKEAVRAWSIGHRNLYTDRLLSKMPTWKDAIALLHRSKATVGLAHPQRYPNLPDMAAILDAVDAVEVIHPTHSLEQQNHWSQEAVRRNKMLWGSHDFHGWSGEQANGLFEADCVGNGDPVQPLTDEDMAILGLDQATPIYWQWQNMGTQEQLVLGGKLSLDSVGPLASLQQFSKANMMTELPVGALEPGEMIRLAEGYFVIDEEDLFG